VKILCEILGASSLHFSSDLGSGQHLKEFGFRCGLKSK